ncbi:hypothetical protein CEUSTIGMA_g8343.t1 [Chlamydomonas eustigma]|uniref:Uncharacterized protein n=1 Tax=Chlamydomonas eustigma TaxID=1157962 RepID=A0A250XCU3_9CHLO|nr:hypothetical protein CEUSTIGMA_g8343.t1 [Chlamydomonas eustigma]|eukprot:GAX80908.1 hypothetical protein CEUSTIGMA_g8343.t1 [Chlamydomonas eustigma]
MRPDALRTSGICPSSTQTMLAQASAFEHPNFLCTTSTTLEICMDALFNWELRAEMELAREEASKTKNQASEITKRMNEQREQWQDQLRVAAKDLLYPKAQQIVRS